MADFSKCSGSLKISRFSILPPQCPGTNLSIGRRSGDPAANRTCCARNCTTDANMHALAHLQTDDLNVGTVVSDGFPVSRHDHPLSL